MDRSWGAQVGDGAVWARAAVRDWAAARGLFWPDLDGDQDDIGALRRAVSEARARGIVRWGLDTPWDYLNRALRRAAGVRMLRGGGAGGKRVLWPGNSVSGYPTVACGRADTIAPREGEVAILVDGGDEHAFACWLVGPIDGLRTYLPEIRGGRELLGSLATASP